MIELPNLSAAPHVGVGARMVLERHRSTCPAPYAFFDRIRTPR